MYTHTCLYNYLSIYCVSMYPELISPTVKEIKAYIRKQFLHRIAKSKMKSMGEIQEEELKR